MYTLITRDQWGAAPPNRQAPRLKRIDEIVIHHSVTDRAIDIDDAKNITRAIQKDHLARENPDGTLQFADIAYNYLIGPGCVLIGRGGTTQGGATGNGWDGRTLSVCVIGDYEHQTVPLDVAATLKEFVDVARAGQSTIPVVPHKAHYATECCGKNLIAILPTLEEPPMAGSSDYFTHPLTLQDGTPPQPYPTNVEGWYTFIHRELQLIRESNQAILDELRRR